MDEQRSRAVYIVVLSLMVVINLEGLWETYQTGKAPQWHIYMAGSAAGLVMAYAFKKK